MSRWECTRPNCKETYFVVDGKISGTEEKEHICKDIRQRLARRNKQAKATVAILDEYFPTHNPDPEFRQAVAEAIVTRLVNMGVENDE
jgi:hypothetical protein